MVIIAILVSDDLRLSASLISPATTALSVALYYKMSGVWCLLMRRMEMQASNYTDHSQDWRDKTWQLRFNSFSGWGRGWRSSVLMYF